MLNIRASKTDLHAACAPSAVEQEWTIGGDRYAGDLGSAAHEVWTRGIGGVQLDIHVTAQKWQVDPDDLQQTMNWCWPRWEKIKRFFVPANVEVGMAHEFPGIRLTGHADVLWIDGNEGRICDGKSGRLDGYHENQIRTYSWLLCCNHSQIEKVRACVFRWPLQVADWETYTRDELARWWDHFSKHLQDQTLFRPSVNHCGFCPRRLNCQAHRDNITKIGTALLDAGEILDSLPTNPRERGAAIGTIFKQAKFLSKVIEQVLASVKAEVLGGGSLQINDVEFLAIREEKRKSIDLNVGKDEKPKVISMPSSMRMLVEEIGTEKMLELLKVGKTEVEKAIKENAGPKQKGKAVKAFLESLERSGALPTTNIISKLELKKGTIHEQLVQSQASGNGAGATAAASPDFAGAVIDRPDTDD